MSCGFDFGDPAFEAHVVACADCARAARLHAMARETWRWERRRDDETNRAARERRIASAAGIGRARGRSARPVGVVAASACAIALTWWIAARPMRPAAIANVAAPGVSPSTAMTSSTSPYASPSAVAQRASAPTAFEVSVVAAHDCPASLVLGSVLTPGQAITLPEHARLRLAWSIDASVVAEVDVLGPAGFVLAEEEGRPTIALTRGAAKIVSSDGRVIVRRSSAQATPSSSTVSATSDKALWRDAEDALGRGDRASAESTLLSLLARTHDGPMRARAELRLSELLLARRALRDARARLEPLALGSDRALAADAALLWARSFSSPRERAEAWRRYLATSPSSPMREHAMLERASALADAGDTGAARALVGELKARALPPVTVEALRRLERRLGAPASE